MNLETFNVMSLLKNLVETGKKSAGEKVCLLCMTEWEGGKKQCDCVLPLRVVTEWISLDEADAYRISVGGLGGFFNFETKGMRWKDFIDRFHVDHRMYYEAIRVSVLENRYRFTGGEHQHGPGGVPLFDDDSVGSFSYRGWGDLMAAIWSEEEDVDYSYVDFYC